MQPEQSRKAFDPSAVIQSVLSYEGYLRLICLLFALGLLLAVAYFVYSSPLYQSRFLIRVQAIATSVDDTGQTRTKIDNWEALKYVERYMSSQVMLVRSAQKLGLASDSASYELIRDSLVPKMRFSYASPETLQVEVFSYHPRIVRELPNAMIEQFREDRIRQTRQAWGASLDRYVVELEELRTKLEQKVGKELRYSEDSDLARTQLRHRQLSNVPIELEVANFKLVELERVLETLRDQEKVLDVQGQLSLIHSYRSAKPLEVGDTVQMDIPGEDAGQQVSSEDSKSVVVIQPEMVESLNPWMELERQERAAQRELDEAKALYLPEHPKMVEITARLGVITDKLEEELKVAKRELNLERESLKNQVKALESRMPEYFAATEELSKKTLTAKLAESGELDWALMYKDIAQQLTRARSATDREPFLLEFEGFLSIRDVDPISPNKQKLLMMGIMLALGLGLGVPFGLQMLKSTSSTLLEIEALTGLPGIGLLPLTHEDGLRRIIRMPKEGGKLDYLLEHFRLIRSNLILHPNRQGKSQAIMVASARPGEGKTTAAANLAWSFYSMGESTLLVDCDLRRGQIHRWAAVDNKVGLTSFLVGEATEREIVQDTKMNNLWIVPRGPVVAGATERLCATDFADLMANWRKHYSRIVIDTPPVLGLSETVSLQRVVDGVVFIVQAEKTSRKDIVDSLSLLRKSGAHLFGFVLNRVDLKKMVNYYNYYHYSSHYYDSMTESEEIPPSEKSPRPA